MALYGAQLQVRDFMQAAEQDGPTTPSIPDFKTIQLRFNLMHEELQEYVLACNRNIIAGHLYTEADILEQVADSLADLIYVTLGTAVAFGIELSPVWEAVHESNMQKFGPGGYRREDGKWLKPADWKAPNIAAILESQMA